MTKTLFFFLAAFLCAAPLAAQSTTPTGQTQTQNQVQQQNLPPAPTCFTCDCNSQNFACQTSCNVITDFSARQQCLAACGQQQSQCLANAQVMQRAVDTQRQALQSTTATPAASQ